MKNIFKIYKRDLKKIFTNSMAIILAVGISVCRRFMLGLISMQTGTRTALQVPAI